MASNHSLSNIHILIFVQHTVNCTARSGIQRVVVEASLALSGIVLVDFVKWDDSDGQLRFLDQKEINQVFGNAASFQLKANEFAHRVNYRFGDLLSLEQDNWILFPEIPYHLSGGNTIFSSIVSQCRSYGVRSAAVFYDLIPVRESAYAHAEADHIEYMVEMLRCDAVIPISKFSADDLLAFLRERTTLANDEILHLAGKISPALLGEKTLLDMPVLTSVEDKKAIILVGTIEPRKQQTRFLRLFNDLCERHENLNKYIIHIFGSLHPDCADELHKERERNPNIQYHSYGPDQIISNIYREAAFSVFISRSEGFGLPIVESLQHGVPCLTSSIGAMQEIGIRGGCHLIDVESDDAINDGILLMCNNVTRLKELRLEITTRVPHTWNDYAGEIIDIMQRSNAANDDTNAILKLLGVVVAKLRDGNFAKEMLVEDFKYKGNIWKILFASSGLENPDISRVISKDSQRHIIFVLDIEPIFLKRLDTKVLTSIAQADVLLTWNQQILDELILELNAVGFTDLLTPYYAVLRDQKSPEKIAFKLINSIANSRFAALKIAFDEQIINRAGTDLANAFIKKPWKLAIVVSTYNRAAFTVMNVRWLLEMTAQFNHEVCIVVVDNASTDGTMTGLNQFHEVPNFIYHRNSANTGMLGNLQIVSTLRFARHTWTIGDDDFIQPGAIDRILAVINTNPYIAMLVVNFGVYHRFKVSDSDTPEIFSNEKILLAPNAIRSGFYQIKNIAEQHDNLFTAIYPLIFRTDLLATCFNYPFKGIPFGDLVESVPTTKFILEQLPCVSAYWDAEIGIVGNAHNSWSIHRPRWHFVLMPRVFQLAWTAGVQATILGKWAVVHKALFLESLEILSQSGDIPHLNPIADAALAKWVFKSAVPMPAEIVFSPESTKPTWEKPQHVININ